MQSSPVQYKAIVEVVGSRIVTGELPVGDTLTLADIEEEFGCSRTVAREVQRSLEESGLTIAQRRRGLVVQPMDNWDVFNPNVIRWRLTGPGRDRQMESLNELRQAIEPRAVALAARFATREQRKEILDAGLKVVELGAISSGEEFMKWDIRFHTLILEASGNEMFAALAPVIEAVLTWRTKINLMPPVPEPRAMKNHEEIAKAIYRGDPETATVAMRDVVSEVQEAFTLRTPDKLRDRDQTD